MTKPNSPLHTKPNTRLPNKITPNQLPVFVKVADKLKTTLRISNLRLHAQQIRVITRIITGNNSSPPNPTNSTRQLNLHTLQKTVDTSGEAFSAILKTDSASVYVGNNNWLNGATHTITITYHY